MIGVTFPADIEVRADGTLVLQAVEPGRRIDAAVVLRACGSKNAIVTIWPDPDLVSASAPRTYDEGVTAERARILRARDAVFAGAVLDDDVRALLTKFDAALRQPGDGRS